MKPALFVLSRLLRKSVLRTSHLILPSIHTKLNLSYFSLSCEHIICHDCLPGISKGADETIHCPQCRGVTERDDLELIHMTEGERWDELLTIARAWCAWDQRGNMETSEEESEENFIDDGEET